jgi:hypothetical protein
MAIAHALPRIFVFKEETQDLDLGLASVDWSTGSRMYVIAPDVSGVKRQHVANDRIRVRPLDIPKDIKTLKSNVEMPFQVYMHGCPDTAAEGAQASITNYPLANLIKCAIGGVARGYSIGIAGGTAAAPVVDNDANITIGDYLWAEKTSSGEEHVYRVLAKPGGNVLTLDRNLHFTPDAGGADVFHAAIDFYIDQDAITHHDDAAHTLLAVLVQGEHADDVLELRGCKLGMTINPINPGEPTRLSFGSMVTSHDWIAAPTIPATIYGEAGSVPGISDTYAAFVADAGSAMASTTLRGTVTPTVGITYEAVPGVGGTEGVLGYVATGFEGIMLDAEALFDEQWLTDYDAGTDKTLLIEIGDTAGSMPWAIHMPQGEIIEQPARSEGSGLTGLKIMLRGRENQASPGALTGANLRKWLSPLHIIVRA